jgi:hypothetical protein
MIDPSTRKPTTYETTISVRAERFLLQLTAIAIGARKPTIDAIPNILWRGWGVAKMAMPICEKAMNATRYAGSLDVPVCPATLKMPDAKISNEQA